MKKIITLIWGLIFTINLNGQIKNEILPIELMYFEGFALSNGILLRWGTATEVNNYGFEIQRGDGNLIFNTIDFVPGSGNSNSPKHYFYIDSTLPSTGNYFYRLKQIDNDGTFAYSDTIQIFYQQSSVSDEKISEIKFSLQNDLDSHTLIIRSSDKNFSGELSFEIYNILGKKVFSKITSFTPIVLNYSNLPSGINLIRLGQNQKTIFTTKFTIIK